MRFDILTLFPEAFDSFRQTSIIGKAVEQSLIEVNTFDIRDFTTDKHRKVDDTPYGGGAGMVLMCQPLFDAIKHVKNLKNDNAPVIFFTPHGQPFDQNLAESFASNQKVKRVILLCGYYEGIDQRVRDELVDQEICIGSFILTSGHLPAQILMDAVGRLLPGVLGKEASHLEESFSQSLGRQSTEYPHYTRPEEFRGLKVPEILLSGHHSKIEDWKQDQIRHKL